jgi:hypothetical protein
LFGKKIRVMVWNEVRDMVEEFGDRGGLYEYNLGEVK